MSIITLRIIYETPRYLCPSEFYVVIIRFLSKVDNNILSVGKLLHLNKIKANFFRLANYVETGDSHPRYLAVRGHYFLLAASCQQQQASRSRFQASNNLFRYQHRHHRSVIDIFDLSAFRQFRHFLEDVLSVDMHKPTSYSVFYIRGQIRLAASKLLY